MTRNEHGRGDAAWEADLLARMRAGDLAARDELWRTHDRALRKLACNAARAWNWDCEVAVQEAREFFLTSLLPKSDPAKGRLITLLYRAIPRALRVARNRDRLISLKTDYNGEAHKHHAHAERAMNARSIEELGRAEENPLGLVDPAPDFRAEVEARDACRRVQDALARLGPADRRLLAQRLIEGRTLLQIGAEEGVTRAAIGIREQKALNRLREEYARAGPRAAPSAPARCDSPLPPPSPLPPQASSLPMPTLLEILDQVTPAEIDRQLAELDAAFAEVRRRHNERRGKLLRLAKTIDHHPGQRPRRASAAGASAAAAKTDAEKMRERVRQRLVAAKGKAVSLGELARVANTTAAATARMLAAQAWAHKAGDRLWVFREPKA